MSANYNRVILMGNLTRDPELRHLPSNTAVANIGLAVNDRYRDKNTQEWVEKPNFIDCEAFGRTAEVLSEYMAKGRPLMIEGKLRFDQWESRDGQKRSKLKVIIDSFQFVGGRDGQGGGSPGGGSYDHGSYASASPGQQSAPPAAGSTSPPPSGPDLDAAPAPGGPAHTPVSDDDIPF